MKLSLGLSPRDYSVAGGVTYDADAQAYFTANTAITSTADKNAINTFYLGLKSDGIYTKIKAMYLPIWGSAASCKWNLINPLDTNAAHRLTFSTGWTFSSGGMTPAMAYANTNLNAQSIFTINNIHLSHYSRTQVTNTDSHDIGCETSPANNWLELYQYYNSVSAKGFLSGTVLADRAEANNTNTLGFLIGTRTSSTSMKSYFNNSLISTNTNSNPATQYPNFNLYIGATNKAEVAVAFTTKQCAFASIGNGLNDTEASNFYSRVQTLMTYFGINV